MQVAASRTGTNSIHLGSAMAGGPKSALNRKHIQTEASRPIACLSFWGRFGAVAIVCSKTPGPCRPHANARWISTIGLNSTWTLRVQAKASAVGVRAAIETTKWWCHDLTKEAMEILIPPANVLLSEVA